MFDRSFNEASFDAHDGPVRCCRAVPRSNDCQSCRTRDKWWEGDGCVDRTEHVQLQPHAKLVAIQTEACPAVRSTQPANALHALIYMIHTASLWKSLCNCLDCHEFSSRKTKTNDETGNRRAKFAKVEQLSGHAVPRSNNCQQLSAAPHLAVMGIKQHPVERPVEHACAEAPRDPRN